MPVPGPLVPCIGKNMGCQVTDQIRGTLNSAAGHNFGQLQWLGYKKKSTSSATLSYVASKILAFQCNIGLETWNAKALTKPAVPQKVLKNRLWPINGMCAGVELTAAPGWYDRNCVIQNRMSSQIQVCQCHVLATTWDAMWLTRSVVPWIVL